MSLPAAVQLISSLSPAEKRYFRIYSRHKEGKKDYFRLFEIINDCGIDDPEIRRVFGSRLPKSSLVNTSRYLVTVLTEMLIRIRMQKDRSFQLLQSLMQVKVLQERSLHDYAYKELLRVRKEAQQIQQPFIEYQTYRFELDFFSFTNFRNVSEQVLIETQMTAKDVLKQMNYVQDHHSLFEMMKYRLLYAGQILSDDGRKKLNDLMLSEMAIINDRMKGTFTTNRLHLLFQSYFFVNIGDFQTSLRTFRELNTVFEKNVLLLDHPPIDYLTTLDGIISSLRMLRRYDEIPYYTEKLNNLDLPIFPEYFQFLVRKSVLAAEMSVFLSKKLYRQAADHLLNNGQKTLTSYNTINEEKQWELYLFSSLVYFGMGNLKKAHAYISGVINTKKLHPFLLVCRATRLLDIIIYYLKGETTYLEHEIKNYYNFFGKKKSLLQTEIFLLDFLQLKPDRKRKRIPDAQHKKLKEMATSLKNDKYEQQLLQYFNFVEWVEGETTTNHMTC